MSVVLSKSTTRDLRWKWAFASANVGNQFDRELSRCGASEFSVVLKWESLEVMPALQEA